MASVLKRVRSVATLPLGALLLAGAEGGPRFLPDDPIRAVPPPLGVKNVKEAKVDALADFLYQSGRPYPRPRTIALSSNTIGEVPDSEWYTNRHAFRRMSREELMRGPGETHVPQPPFTVVGGKSEGITPGFRLRDARGRLYFCKPDPAKNPEMASGAEMIGSRVFYALGYNTPEDYLVRFRPADLRIDDQAEITGISGRKRPLRRDDLDAILSRAARAKDGTIRILASLSVPGKSIGPFRYEGMRPDDPNDVVPHERRRELRGLAVFAAWVDHTDVKAENSLDVVVQEHGLRFVRHYLIDFGSILGSASDMPKPAYMGNVYMLGTPHELLVRLRTFGLYSPAWERAKYVNMPAIGRFESAVFDPEKWVPNYPNPAFLSRGPDDEFWAARQVMAFTDDDIRALVETAEYSNPKVTDYIARTLIARRDKIGFVYLGRGLALDRFRVEDGELKYDDLAAEYNIGPRARPRISWTRYDNRTRIHTPLAATSAKLPPEWHGAAPGSYFSARLSDGPDRKVDVYLRKNRFGPEVVGMDREWGEDRSSGSLSAAIAARHQAAVESSR